MANILYDHCFNTTYKSFVRDVYEENGLFWHYFDETIFYPENGGMLSDQGFVNSKRVLSLKKENNKVWHLLDTKIEGEVDLVVDYHLRFHHAQCHSAQHLISGIVESVYGCKTLSHHVHDKYCDIEFDREVFNDRQIKELRALVNGLIRDDLPIKIFYPLEKEVKYYTSKDVSDFDEVRIVSIGKIDSQPCGCIHVPSLRYIQAISILGCERTRKGMKLHYVCGDHLLNTFDENISYLSKLSSLTAQPFEFIESGVVKIINDNKVLNNEINMLKLKQAEIYCEKFINENKLYEHFDGMDLKMFGMLTKTMKKISKKPFIFSTRFNERIQLYICIEDSLTLFNEIAQLYNLQGGGNKSFAQGGGIYKEDIITYLKNIGGKYNE